MTDKTQSNGDSDELEALFDSIVKANKTAQNSVTETAAPAPTATAAPTAAATSDDPFAGMAEPAKSMYSQIGHLTRKLHDTLHELGYDKSLEQAAAAIPDARDRLAYIATLTEQAAEKTLNAIDLAKPLQDQIESESAKLNKQWDRLFAKQLSIDEFKQLVHDTRSHLTSSEQKSQQTNERLLEIMMAQDFQDLTGQVIKKVVEMAKQMETHLFEFLLEFTPGKKIESTDTLMNGPVIKPDGRTDVVTSQQQVDDLLDSLGF